MRCIQPFLVLGLCAEEPIGELYVACRSRGPVLECEGKREQSTDAAASSSSPGRETAWIRMSERGKKAVLGENWFGLAEFGALRSAL